MLISALIAYIYIARFINNCFVTSLAQKKCYNVSHKLSECIKVRAKNLLRHKVVKEPVAPNSGPITCNAATEYSIIFLLLGTEFITRLVYAVYYVFIKH